MADRPGFMMYFDFAPALSKLTDEEAGALFKAIMGYAKNGQIFDLPGICGFAFEVIRPRIDRDREVYEEKCRKNSYTAYVREAKKRNEEFLGYEQWLSSFIDGHDGARTCTNVDERSRFEPTTTQQQLNSNTTQPNSTTTTTTTTNNEEGGPVPNPDVAAVISDYLNRINPSASPFSLEELSGYAEEMGKDVCIRAFDIALDSKKTTWSYIRAILRDKQARGVKCLADWDALEADREKNRKHTAAQEPPDYGNPEDFYK